MSRNSAERRDFSKRKAKRKQYIAEHIYGWEWYNNLHQYSKNKIHCSCPCCSAKTNNSKNRSRGPVDPNRYHSMKISGPWSKNWKPADRRKIEGMDEQEKEVQEENSSTTLLLAT